MNQWYYLDDGIELGPVSSAELKEFATDGTIGPDTIVWKEGANQRVRAGDINGLIPLHEMPDESQQGSFEQPTGGGAGAGILGLVGIIVVLNVLSQIFNWGWLFY